MNRSHFYRLIAARLRGIADDKKPKRGKWIPEDKVEFRTKEDGSGVFPINKETGEIGGVVGEEIEKREKERKGRKKYTALPEKPNKLLEDYITESNGNVVAGCELFYENELENHRIRADVGGGQRGYVKFTQTGKNKLRDIIKRSPHLAQVLPFIPDIITNGKCLGYNKDFKQEEKGESHKHYPNGFVSYIKKCSTRNGDKWVIVDVGIPRDGNSYEEYSFIDDQSYGWEKKKKALNITADGSTFSRSFLSILAPAAKNGAVSASANDSDNIMEYEFVNIRIVSLFPEVEMR